MTDDVTVHDSCGNIFRDMGMPDADDRLANAERIRQIRQRMRANGVSPAEFAKLAGISEADLMNTLRGRYSPQLTERMWQVAEELGIG